MGYELRLAISCCRLFPWALFMSCGLLDLTFARSQVLGNITPTRFCSKCSIYALFVDLVVIVIVIVIIIIIIIIIVLR
jgi:hypothetical protein